MDNRGFSKYDLENGMIARVNQEDASCLYDVVTFVLNDINSEKEIYIAFDEGKTTLLFEYKPDEENQMSAYFTIKNDDQSILFKFETCTVLVIENGQKVFKVFQSDLGAFAKILEGYLTSSGVNHHLNRLQDNLNFHKKQPCFSITAECK
jgi:hypothetical protein